MSAKTWFPVNIVGGIEGNSNDQLKTRLNVAENLVYRTPDSLSFRYGTRILSRTADLSTDEPIDGICDYNGSALRTGVGKLNLSVDDTYRQIDSVSEAVVEYTALASSARSFLNADIGSNGLFDVYVYREYISGSTDYSDIYLTITDSSTGTVTKFHQYKITTGATFAAPKVVMIGNTAYIFYCSSTGAIYADSIDISSIGSINTAVVGSPALIVTNAAVPPAGQILVYDVISDGTNLYLYYKETATDTFYCLKLSSALATVGTYAYLFVGVVQVGALSIAVSGTTLWLADSFRTATDQYVRVIKTSTSMTGGSSVVVSTSATVLDYDMTKSLGLIPIGTSLGVIGSDGLHTTWTALVSGTPSITSARTDTIGLYNVISRPWLTDSKSFAVIMGQTIPTSIKPEVVSFYVAELVYGQPLRPVATIIPRQGTPVGFLNSSQYTPLANVYKTGNFVKTTFTTSLISSAESIGSVYTLNVEFNPSRTFARVGDLTMLSGGVPSFFDGTIVGEAGFLDPPYMTTPIPSGTGGSLSTGSYQYAICREWTDSKGFRHRSQPYFAPAVVTSTSSSSTSFQITNTAFTTRQDAANNEVNKIVNVLYRTKVGDTTFHRVTTFPAVSPFLNSLTTSSFNYVDTASDASIATNEPLYSTTNTALGNVNPPSARFVCTHNDRFWLAGTPDDSIWYSKTFVNYQASGFNEVLTVQPFEGGRVTGIASLDSYLVVFKSDSTWIIMNDGNNALGTGSTLSNPLRISNELGTTQSGSIVVTNFGVFFNTKRGIHLLTKNDNQVLFIGADVSDFTQAPTSVITSATVVASQNQVRFSLVNDDPTKNCVLVYDYLTKNWTTFRYWDAASEDYLDIQKSAIIDGKYNFIGDAVDNRGVEYIEDTSTYLDNGTHWTPKSLETGWIRIADLQGYQRVSRVQMLGEYHEPHSVTMTEKTDYRQLPVYDSTRQSTILPANSPVQYEYGIVSQRSEAVKLKFTINEPQSPTSPGTGRGFIFTGLGLLVSAVRGKWRVAPGRRSDS